MKSKYYALGALLVLSCLGGYAYGQGTYFSGQPEGVQSFQKQDVSWRRQPEAQKNNFLQSIQDSIGNAAVANITGAEQVFCYQVANRPHNYSGYTLNGMVITGFCGVVSQTLQETIKNEFFANENNIDFLNSEKCIIKPRLMLRWVRGVDSTDMLISAPCYSYSIFYGGKVKTFNFKPGAEIIDTMVEAFQSLSVDFVSPALLNQLLPIGVPQTTEQKETIKQQSGPIRKWEQQTQPKKSKKSGGWNSLQFGK